MQDVDQIFLKAMAIEDVPAGALHVDPARLSGLPFVRRKPLPGIPKRVFPSGPIPLVAPLLEICEVTPLGHAARHEAPD